MLFYFNNSGSCVVYSIDSASTELDAEWISTQTNNKTTLVISNFEYTGNYIFDVVSIDYDLILDNEIIATGGYDLDDIKYDNKEFDIKSFFRIITIYLDNNKNYDFNKKKSLVIKFKYIDKDGKTSDFKLPLKIERRFTNNKFFYFK